MAKLKAALLAGAVAATGFTAAYLLSDSEDEAAGTRHLVNQVWIERMPANPRDMISHMVILDQDGEQFGVFGRSSAFRHVLEVFGWRLERNRLKLFFPQERVKADVKARTWRCEGEAPEPFELCMELSQNGRSIQFYSRTDWVIEDAASLQDLAMETPELAGVFEAAKTGPVPAFDGEDFRLGILPLE